MCKDKIEVSITNPKNQVPIFKVSTQKHTTIKHRQIQLQLTMYSILLSASLTRNITTKTGWNKILLQQ